MAERKTLIHVVGESTPIQLGLVLSLGAGLVAASMWAARIQENVAGAREDIREIKEVQQEGQRLREHQAVGVSALGARMGSLEDRVKRLETR